VVRPFRPERSSPSVRESQFEMRAKDSDTARAHEALARIRLLYAVEAQAKVKGLTGTDLAVYRQEHARPGSWFWAR
jgi:hypothetical protein